MEGDARGTSREACASLEDKAQAGETPLAYEVANEALPTKEAGGLPPWAKWPSLALSGARKTRPPDKLILGSYVMPLEWNRPLADALTPNQEVARLLVRKCSPFKKRDSLVAYIYDLYPQSFHVPMVARSEEYSIPFPNYMDKGSCQRVEKEGMYIHNHDFNETIELVWSDL